MSLPDLTSDPTSVVSGETFSFSLAAFFFLPRFDIGSRDIVRARGGRRGPMSTVSTR